MTIQVLKTGELSEDQWKGITVGFNEAFEKNVSIDQFKKYYASTITGYSYHAFATTPEGKIVGYNALIPMPYGEHIFGYSGGTYILNNYRNDITLLKRLLSGLEKAGGEDGVGAILAVPNKNSLTYFTRIARFTPLDQLNYHILPIKLSKLVKKKYLRLFDILSYVLSIVVATLNYLVSIFINTKEPSKKYEIADDEIFFQKRFFQDHYNNVRNKSFNSYYRVVHEEGIKTAYIMEFRQKGIRSLRALAKIVFHILMYEKCDIIMFVGHLRMKQLLLLRVPKKLEPQKLNLVFKVNEAVNGLHNEIISKPENWNFSLINFDVR